MCSCMYVLYCNAVRSLERCPHFRSVLIEGFHCSITMCAHVCTVLQCRTVIRGVSSFQVCRYRGVPLYSITICVLMYVLYCNAGRSLERCPHFRSVLIAVQYNYMCARVHTYCYCNAQDGHLRPGDQILEVDGTDLLGCTQER